MIKPTPTKSVWNCVLQWETWEKSVTERLISFNSSSCQQPKNIHSFWTQNKKANTSANKKTALELTLDEIRIGKENCTCSSKNCYLEKTTWDMSSLMTATLQLNSPACIRKENRFFSYLHLSSAWFIISLVNQKSGWKCEGGKLNEESVVKE